MQRSGREARSTPALLRLLCLHRILLARRLRSDGDPFGKRFADRNPLCTFEEDTGLLLSIPQRYIMQSNWAADPAIRRLDIPGAGKPSLAFPGLAHATAPALRAPGAINSDIYSSISFLGQTGEWRKDRPCFLTLGLSIEIYMRTAHAKKVNLGKTLTNQVRCGHRPSQQSGVRPP
jgi:hypothetical protein